MNWPRTLHFFLSVSLLVACEGSIGSSNEGPMFDAIPDAEREVVCSAPEIGAPIRRLNRFEIAYALEDVLGVDASAFRGLPRDGTVGGFATVGSQLSSGALFTEAYLALAEEHAAAWARDLRPDCLGESGCFVRTFRDAIRRLYRRTPSADELARFDRIADEVQAALSEDFTAEEAALSGFETALSALVASPAFLFVERERSSETARALNPHELATRLALTLWSSVPDQALLDAAEDGSLNAPEGFVEQLDRMMDDSRFARFTERFVDSWLTFERLDNSGVDAAAYGLDDATWTTLLQDMKAETRAYIRHVLDEERPLEELFTGDYTFLNARLANHYGIEGPSGEDFVRVELGPETDRRGLLTQGAILSQATSGDEVSVVVRGEAILAGFLCQPPPAPPESVLEEIDAILEADPSELEKMEMRAANPQCAGCHAAMDPVGWAFHGFDGVAAAGDSPPGSGVFDEQNFSGARELIDLLTQRQRYASCFTEKLMIFAVGRRFMADDVDEDLCIVRGILERAGQGGSLREHLRAALTSEAFRVTGPLAQHTTEEE